MNLFFVKLKQSPVFAIILCILLAASSAATTIGATGLADALAQEASIDENYTTIAIQKSEESPFWRIADSPYCVGTDTRILMAARVKDGKAPSTGSLEPLNYNFSVEIYPYTMSVFAVKCLKVADNKVPTPDKISPEADYNITCEIVDWVSIIDAYDLPPYEDQIVVYSNLRRWDGSIPFEVGKTYLVRGLYDDYYYGYQEIPEDFDFFSEWESLKRMFPRTLDAYILPGMTVQTMLDSGYVGRVPHWGQNLHIIDSDAGEYFWTQASWDWPYYTEYEGDWRDFLNTERGEIWRDEILPYMELNHESLSAILTDNVDSMYYFCTGAATVLHGRKFTQEEYDKGEKVCMVSAAYAQLNDLSVGDRINLEFYKLNPYIVGAEDSAGYEGNVIKRDPITREAAIGVQGDYEIVGIYAAPEWLVGTQAFSADTVFVPKASVPGADQYKGSFLPILNSAILKNGTIEATEAYLAEKGHANEFFYFDQGYEDALEAIATMKANGQRLMVIGVASLVIVGLLFLWLYDRRTAKIARNMRLLGVKKSDVWLQDMAAILLLELIAIILGTVAAAVIADADILTALVEFAALALVSGVWVLGTVNRNLLRRK